MDSRNIEKEKEHLSSIIRRWNDSRLDLFAISLPDKNLECHGVMRFYHKDSANDGKYATKCIRVSSKMSTKEVIEMLTTKFRPDMRMLTKPVYAISEVHVNGEMRQLNNDEKPLLVQLTWVKDDREGRFLLHNKCDTIILNLAEQLCENEDSSFKLTRTLTKKEKKLKKKHEKEMAVKKASVSSTTGTDENTMKEQQEIYAVKQLYIQVPESTFTRTVSNPEAVMKKQRERRLLKRGANVLKVYGDRINPEIPYKSLFLLPTDDVSTVIQDALDKYGLGKESASDYSLIKVVLPPKSKPEEMLSGGWGMETVLPENESPLEIEKNWQPHEGTLVFQLRKITNDSNEKDAGTIIPSLVKCPKRKEKSNAQTSHSNPTYEQHLEDKSNMTDPVVRSAAEAKFPKLFELVGSSCREHVLSADKTDIGWHQRGALEEAYVEIQEHGVAPSLCVITTKDGISEITPQAGIELLINGTVVRETMQLQHGYVFWVGRKKPLFFCQSGKKLTLADMQKRVEGTKPDVKIYPDEMKGIKDAQTSGDDWYNDQTRPSNGILSHTRDQKQYKPSNITYTHPVSCSRKEKNGKHSTPSPRMNILPASLQLCNGAEETFLMEVVSVTGANLHFKLSPAYAIYLSLRDIVEVRPTATLRPVLLEYLCIATDLLDQTIQLNSKVANELSFWMANTSELLNFIRHDGIISPCTGDAQDALAKTVQLAFRHLVQCMQRDLFQLMPGFLSESDEDLPGNNILKAESGDHPNMYNVLHMLSSTMSLLRRCRVNAALTIQLFSQLFHFINMWLFNEVVCKPNLGLCCRRWSRKIRARLARVEAWAEKQGLELAADCHLARITQAMHLLQAPKQSAEDIAAISGTCFKLNSLQLRALLTQYIPSVADHERQIPNELIDKVVQVAQNTADELTRSDGRDVQLKEDPDLQLPFLLPEDGYSCDVVRSVPSGLTDFTGPLVSEGLCGYAVNAGASGYWTVHFGTEGNNQMLDVMPVETPVRTEMATITFSKKDGGLGLSIVAARGARQSTLGIYIRSVVPGGAAFQDERLQVGDQLLSVDGKSLIGVSQEKAAEIMTKTGQVVTLTVGKGAAISQGLGILLEPSPSTERAQVVHRRPGQHRQPRPKSEGFVLQMQDHEQQQPQLQSMVHHTTTIKPNNYSYSHASATHDTKLQQSSAKPGLKYSVGDLRKGKMLTNDSTSPRPAMSMGNLQASHNHQKPDDWKLTWEARRAQHTYQRDRSKSSSSSALPVPQTQTRSGPDAYDRRRMVQSMITGQAPKSMTSNHSGHAPPRATSAIADQQAPKSDNRGQVIANPNYASLPSPPPPPSILDKVERSVEDGVLQNPTDSRNRKPAGNSIQQKLVDDRIYLNLQDVKSPVESIKSTEKQKTRQASPGAAKIHKKQKQMFSKSSTLPRHFSTTAWDIDSQQRAVQEELNALRDEEIEELSAKMDSLTTIEKNRLSNLLKEREFQRRVGEENRKSFMDEDGSDEEYGVPDRPDRDRLLRLQDNNSDNFPSQHTQDNFVEESKLFKPEKDAPKKTEMQSLRKDYGPKSKCPQDKSSRFETTRIDPGEMRPQGRVQERVRQEFQSGSLQVVQSSEEDEDEEAERKLLESKLSQGKSNNYPNYGRVSLRFGSDTTESTTIVPRPVSDGYLLRQTVDLQQDKPETPSPDLQLMPIKVKPNANVVGTQEWYLDPRERREMAIKREQSLKRKQQETSFMTFRDRQRIFSGNIAPVRKPAASKKLIEIENSLRRSERTCD